MNERIITDISDFIFLSDKPQKVDAVFCRAVRTPNSRNMRQSCIIKALLNVLSRQEV